MKVEVSASMCCSWEAVRMRVEKAEEEEESMSPDLLWLGLPKSIACRRIVGNFLLSIPSRHEESPPSEESGPKGVTG